MKFGGVNKSTTVNRFVLHTLQRNIKFLAVITRKRNIKLGILKGGNWKRAKFCSNPTKVNTVFDVFVVKTIVKEKIEQSHFR